MAEASSPPIRGGSAWASAGAAVLGVAACLMGAVGLWSGDFAAVWQPVPLETPNRPVLAYAAGALFLIAGTALQDRRAARLGAVMLGALFIVFAVLWLPRVIARPLVFATWGGVAEQLACALGALAVYGAVWARAGRHAAPLAVVARVGFGVCAIAFGFNHFFALRETAALVPRWAPGGALAWAGATGVFHVLGGLALVTGVQALLAARLLTTMFACFGLLVWLPVLLSAPSSHVGWCGNAVNLTLVGAAWALADMLADMLKLERQDTIPEPSAPHPRAVDPEGR